MENQDILKAIQSGDIFTLTREEMALLLPWLRETLTAQERKDENSDLCQLTARILRLSNRLYGTEPGDRSTCICHG
ncbi:hypothetical protein [Streptomyces canus]|uniref:hypothetical protein n=1 Tax=Streptomyces canus TaxID=58343 RepID=UPI00278B73C6|nr:hypothetical protein [Streptomyces canus]MDQ0762024.1 hypothetical protein [Streptomyces canus]